MHIYPEKQKSSSLGFADVEVKKTHFYLVENIILRVNTRMWCASTASLMSSDCWKDVLESKISICQMFMGLCQILDLKLYLQRNIDNYQSMPRVLKYLLYLSEIQYKIALCCN